MEEVVNLDIAVYIPYLNFNHFGHYLTETASSLSYLLFLSMNQSRLPASASIIVPFFCSRLAELLGMNENRFIVKGHQPLRVKYLLAFAPTLANPDFVSVSHAAAVKQLIVNDVFLSCSQAARKLDPTLFPSKVYISRSKLNRSLRLFEEEEKLELLLSRSGWFIFYPQFYAVSDQILLYENCKIVCGCNGSSLHLL